MNVANTDSRSPVWQFSLRSLFAATVLAALALWVWRSSGFLGVAYLAAFLSIAVGNLAIALFGARFGQSVLAGMLGGAILWSIVAVCLGMLDAGVFHLEYSLTFCAIGVLIGLLCGGYARRKRRPVNDHRRKGMIYCVILFVAFATVFGLGRFLALQKLLKPDFASIHSYAPDSDGIHILEFWGNGIGDGSLDWELSRIPKDRKLVINFRYTRVTDEGIRQLGDFPNLVSVDLRGTSVSENGEHWLRGKLPDCAIRR